MMERIITDYLALSELNDYLLMILSLSLIRIQGDKPPIRTSNNVRKPGPKPKDHKTPVSYRITPITVIG